MSRLFASSELRGVSRLALAFVFVVAAAYCVKSSPVFSQSHPLEAHNAESVESAGAVENNDNTESTVVRLVRRDGAPVKMETAVVRYSGKYRASDGVERDVNVDLIGAVHIADAQYYQDINELFQEYETVVYELITDEDSDAAIAQSLRESREKKNKKRNFNPLNFISYFQEDLGKALGLTYQIDGINYEAENLRHGDSTSIEFISQLFANGDVVQFFIKTFALSLLDEPPGSAEGAVVTILCSRDRRLTAKRLMAVELADTTIGQFKTEIRAVGSNAESENPRRKNTMIHYRNGKALDVLRKELDEGREKVAIFYGAAHLPDLGMRLQQDFNMTLEPEARWFKAWDLERSSE
ncbi:MAG: hypothetical protein ACOX0A_08930 [Thermoguttaceae bacterium]|jgi:hypothetical protein